MMCLMLHEEHSFTHINFEHQAKIHGPYYIIPQATIHTMQLVTTETIKNKCPITTVHILLK